MRVAKSVKKCYYTPIKTRNIGGIVLDRITNSLMDKFSSDYELNLDNSRLFEYFTNFCAASNENGTENLNLEELSTGENAQGIDGIAIIVNGRFVYSIEDVKELLRLNKTMRVKFVISQSKTSESFDNAEMLNCFCYTKKYFLDSDATKVFKTEEMQNFIEIKDFIFDNAPALENNPILNLYYFTAGSWQNDSNLVSIINDTSKELMSSNLFSKVNIIPCGAEEIQKMYRKTRSELSATFKFEKKVAMYSINENEIGYCGVIPFSEYKKIILDDSGALKPVFEDNIRDFLGINVDVNMAIEETLREGNINSFSMLNNGIMIVASISQLVGDIMTIKDYQIVNGCQTSHMLFEHIDDMDHLDNLMIPVRIIITSDENLKNRITKATNNQTAIKKEQLEALSTFQKNLEEYYKTFTKSEEQLYYERRSGQYRNAPIVRSKIVTIPMQIKTVTAMFLNNPSGVSGQYGTIAKNVGNKIFKSTDKCIIYYTSSMALYRVESLMKTGAISRKLWKTRYHAMMLLRLVIEEEPAPKFSTKKMEKYCNKILDVLNDEEKCFFYFNTIIKYISEESGLDLDNRKTFERKETTETLLTQLPQIKDYIKKELNS